MISKMDRRLVWGINPTWAEDVNNPPPNYNQLMVQKIVEAHGQSTRYGLNWDLIEPNPPQGGQHSYYWGPFDAKVDIMVANGIESVGLIIGTPNWANPDPSHGPAFKLPLHQYETDFVAFCTALATRYSGKVRYYEFWNEPNGAGMGFDVVEYTWWLIRAYQGVKAGDSTALLSTGGLAGARESQRDYLNAIYDNGGQNYLDAVGVHPYRPWQWEPGPIDIDGVRDFIRPAMVAHNDSAKSIWLTEYGGWQVPPLTQEQQRDYLLTSLAYLDDPQYNYITQASYHTIADHEVPQPAPFGLCYANLNPRLAFYAFRDFAAPRTPRWEIRAPVIQMV